MKSKFTELNQLVRGQDGVFRGASEKEFNYSDGEDAEQKLHRILSAAKDLGSDSAELDAQIDDWPTEYHLSSSRANLLRSLNLGNVHNVLELGCGCGSISRYLGEQQHLNIDAVEGSSIRASLAALRCRDQANVTISSGNFNQMKFPQDHYDLVLFVGVTEYAGRFSDRKTDQQALQDLLSLASAALSENGTVVIAIENRTGLKYMMGAGEDHYGRGYVGIDDYPQSTGIRTYSKAQWEEQLAQSDFAASRFAYPFPDYKIPTLLITESSGASKAECSQALAKIRSRDYLAPFDLGAQEARLWQSVVESDCLSELSNSYMILLGQDQSKLEQLLPAGIFEFAEGPSSQQKERSVQTEPVLDRENEVLALLSKIKILRAEASQLENKIYQLQHQLDTLALSRVWKIRNRIRSWLRK